MTGERRGVDGEIMRGNLLLRKKVSPHPFRENFLSWYIIFWFFYINYYTKDLKIIVLSDFAWWI